MNKAVALILGAVLASLPVLTQSNPSSTKPRHCSVKRGSAEPQYPDSLKGSGIQGTVVLEAIVSENGCVHSVRVVRKLHPKLDENAKQTVSSWKSTPATKDGKPVMAKVQIQVEFKDTGK
jgi:TonB family protein